MSELAGFQRLYLRGLGHALRPLVQIGKAGLTPAVEEQVRRELAAHELVKVRLLDFRSQRHELGRRLAEATGAALVGAAGFTLLLYRPQPDPERRRIRLPERGRRADG